MFSRELEKGKWRKWSEKRENQKEEEMENRTRKLNFLEKMQHKIVQGGYQSCSDTVLRNMASMKIERKA